jgi:hypothetical protein
MKLKSLFLGGAVLASLLTGNPAHAQGTKFTYQGRLNDAGVAANGSYDLTFQLWTAAVGGSQVLGTGTLTNSPVIISNGLFTVALDFGAGAFEGSSRFLQIAARTNGVGAFTNMTPRQELTPAPYAIYAAGAALGINSVNSGHIIDGQVLTADLGDNAVTSAKVLNGSLTGSDLANNTVGSAQLADTIALGDATTSGFLTLYKVAGGGPAVNMGSLNGGYEILFQDDGQSGILLDGDSGGGGLEYIYAADGSIGLVLDGDSGGAGLISVLNTNGSTRLSLDGAGSGAGGQITVNSQDGSSTVQLFGESSGAGLINVNNNVSATRVAIHGEGSGSGGQISLYAADGGDGISLYGDNQGGGLEYLYAADGSISISLDAESGGAGYLSLRNTGGSTRVGLDGYNSTSGSGEISVYDSSGTETVEILGGETASTGGQILMRNAAGGNTIQLDSDASGVACGYLQLSRADGTPTITLQADYSGDGRIITQELQITGGSDLSEQFDINPAQEALQPGMVVCIDPEHPGELVASTRAYDHTVAGVISGAGGVKTGMMMGQVGTKADGKQPVALTGRVYVLADASNGSIKPGDLLTTSSTPGHAMKATNHSKAYGAVLGKAMTGLSQGKGTVLVLVSLQ